MNEETKAYILKQAEIAQGKPLNEETKAYVLKQAAIAQGNNWEG